jgi:hypothetical protein
MNAAAGFAYMAFTRIIDWNFDRQYSGAVRTILHTDFLKMGFDSATKGIAKDNLICH